MALNKQSIPINFAKGLDLKTDPFQVPLGRFLELKNSVFNKGNLLQKRNGFGALEALPNNLSTHLATFNGNLTAIGDRLEAFSQGSSEWIDAGYIQPMNVDTLSLIKNNTNQIQIDAAVSPNDFVCLVYTDQSTDGVTYRYSIMDSTTGQIIVAPTEIESPDGDVIASPKVWLLGNNFVLVFPVFANPDYHLQYISIGIYNPSSSVSIAADISTQYEPSDVGINFDGYIANNNLYLAWNGSDLGDAIRLTYIDSTLQQHNTAVFAGNRADFMSVAVDESGSTPVIYASFYDDNTSKGYTLAVNQILNQVFPATEIIDEPDVVNITSSADEQVCTVFYEKANSYTYDAAIPTNYIKKTTITEGGVAGTPEVLIRSLGLASKAFKIDDLNVFFLGIYVSDAQPTYFMVDQDGNIVQKLAYSNASGYYTLGLPNVCVEDTVARYPYFFKDTIQAVNKSQNANAPNGIYSQLGVNLATITFRTSIISSSDIGDNLNFSGGFMWAYDGLTPTEQGFHVWPDDVEANLVADIVETGDTTNGSDVIENMSSVVGITVGMAVSGTGIPVNTFVLAIDGSDITISNDATATNTGVSLTFEGNLANQQYFYQVTYEWSDNKGNIFRSAPSIPVTVTTSAGNSAVEINVPTLRLTYKIANPVKIVIYRWSQAQQTYYQITSVNEPLLNDPTIDSIAYTDVQPDADILGNEIIYTTGGVLENIAAPATDVITLFNNRLWLLNSENKNEWWYSKQVLANTPVEMTDLQTIFVAPTTAAQGNTGPVRCGAPMDDKLIMWKKNAIYYISGQGPDITGANNQYSEPIFITSTVGCENQASIVFMPNGLMFQSGKGIWLLGRDLSTSYIGADVESLTDGATVLSALNIPGTNQVRFTLDTGITLMYDYYYGQWGTFTGVPAISSTLYQDLHTYLNNRGEVFQETPGKYLDASNPVLMSFKTSWFNVAGLQGYERAYFFYLLGVFITPHKLSVRVAYDYNDSAIQQSIIYPVNYAKPWGDEQLWGSNGPWGGSMGNVEQWRVFFKRQKCQSFQLTIDEIYDRSYGVSPGAGLTLSGMNLIIGGKDIKPKLKPTRSVG